MTASALKALQVWVCRCFACWPRLSEVSEGLDWYQDCHCSLSVAVMRGSVVRQASSADVLCWRYLVKVKINGGLPLLCSRH